MAILNPETNTQNEAEITPLVTLTDKATEMVRNLLTQQDNPDLALRVYVSGGGCSGLQYGMAFDDNVMEGDNIIETSGIRVLVDPISARYIAGSEVDYVDALMGGGFTVNNPNAVSSCGCGHSFHTAETAEDESMGGCSSCGHH